MVECGLTILGLLLLVAPVVSLVLGARNRRRIEQLELSLTSSMADARRRQAELIAEVEVLRASLSQTRTPGEPAPSDAAEAEARPAGEPFGVSFTPEVTSPAQSIEVPPSAGPAEIFVRDTSEPPLPLEDTPPATPESIVPSEIVPAAATPADWSPPVDTPPQPAASAYGVGLDSPPIESGPPGGQQGSLPPPAISPPSPPRHSPLSQGFDWEGLVGVKLFSWIAGIALTVGAISFLKYTVEHGWLTPPRRALIGLISGLSILAACELRVARRYRFTANAMDGAGICILYATLFASHALWNLIGLVTAFIAMALVTAAAAFLSVRRDSIFIALLGLIGGFSTPALLSSGQDRPVGLFGYLLLLNLGLAAVAYKRGWPVLSGFTLLFTTLYQWGWVVNFLTEAKLRMAMTIFAIFPVVTLLAYWAASRRPSGNPPEHFRKMAAVSALLPIFFALYVSVVPAFGSRYQLLFGFLFIVVAGLAVVALTHGPELLHLLGAAVTVAIFAFWFSLSYTSAAWPVILVVISFFVLFYLAVPLLGSWSGRPFTHHGLMASLAAPILLFTFPVLAGIERAAERPLLLFGVLLVLVSGIALFSFHQLEQGHYFVAALMSIAAEIVWSKNHLGPQNLVQGLIVYFAFAALFIAAPAITRARGRELISPKGTGVVLLSTMALLLFLGRSSIAGISLPGMAALLFLLVWAIDRESAFFQRPALVRAGGIAAWVVAARWWFAVDLPEHQLAAITFIVLLSAVVGLTPIGIGFFKVARSGSESVDSPSPLFLSLSAYLFLVHVAITPSLAIPPWPLFIAIIAVVIAIAVGSWKSGNMSPHVLSVIAAQLTACCWVIAAQGAAWPAVGIAFAVVVSGLAVTVHLLVSGRSVQDDLSEENSSARDSGIGAVAALFLAQAVTVAAIQAEQRPPLLFFLFCCVAIASGLLWLACRIEAYGISVAAALSSAAVYAIWRSGDSAGTSALPAFGVALVIYGLFIGFPLLPGGQTAGRFQPYFAAIVASVPFFFVAREALLHDGFRPVIGLLPVGQAAALSLLVWRLLKLEPPGARDLRRLAWVAGAALAFVSVAIPVQLDKEWITIGWALEVAALAWLYLRVPHRGLLAAAGGLALVVFVRLTFNPALLAYHPGSTTPVINWYLYTYLVPAAAFFAAAVLLRKSDDVLAGTTRLSTLLSAAGTILLFLIVNIEVADYFAVDGQALTFRFSGSLAEDLTYTIAWAIFAIALLIAGIALGNRAARIASLPLLLVTVFKCFFHDLWRLGGLYRVASFVGLAISLALVAVLMQKYVMTRRESG